MAVQIDIVSQSDGIHYLEFGVDANTTGGWAVQLWVTRYGPHIIDWAQSLGMGFITFMDNDLWVMNSDEADRCNLFGEQKDCMVGIVSNEQSNKIKLYDALGIHSDSEWEVVSVTIPASLNYPSGMASRIPTQRFKARDGVWRAEFLRNMYTSSGTENTLDLLRGEPLRGHACYMILKNTSTEQVKLFKVDISQTVSRV